jgi:TonB family protein
MIRAATLVSLAACASSPEVHQSPFPICLESCTEFSETAFDQDPIINPTAGPKTRVSRAGSPGLSSEVEVPVELGLLVSEEGEVLRVEVLSSSGDQAFDTSAAEIASQFQFVPGFIGGEPAQGWIGLSFSSANAPPNKR